MRYSTLSQTVTALIFNAVLLAPIIVVGRSSSFQLNFLANNSIGGRKMSNFPTSFFTVTTVTKGLSLPAKALKITGTVNVTVPP